MEEDFYIAESDLTRSMKAIRFYFHKVSPYTPRMATRLFWYLFTKPRSRKLSKVDEGFYQKVSSEAVVSKTYNAPFLIHRTGQETKKVLILHGWESRASDFSKLVDKLKTIATVYVLDFPGHGKSPKSIAHLPMFVDVIESTLDSIGGIDTVIGHSLGAASLAMAIGDSTYQNTIDKLVFLGLHPQPSQYFLQYKKVTKVNDKVFERCVKLAESKTGVKLLDYSCYHYLANYEQYETHFIHDEMDSIIRVERVEDLADKLEKSQVFKGDHGGHFRHYKNQEVIDHIFQIVNKNAISE